MSAGTIRLSGAGSGEVLAQPVLLDLAAGGHRELVDDDEFLGPELAGHLLSVEKLGELGERRRFVDGLDERAADLAESFMRLGDDCSDADGGGVAAARLPLP